MSKEACIIKGTKHGLSISIPSGMDFGEVLTQLRTRLASAQEFLQVQRCIFPPLIEN